MENRFETFTVLVNRISRNIRRIKNQEMAEYDLRSAHISCLYYLYANPGLTATDLCERCEEDKATISRALEYLEGIDRICAYMDAIWEEQCYLMNFSRDYIISALRSFHPRYEKEFFNIREIVDMYGENAR